MKNLCAGIILIALMGSCKKTAIVPLPVDPPAPAMTYVDLTGRETTFDTPQHIDIDGDGNRDFSFVTYHIGDPALRRDIIQFAATSPPDRLLLVDANESTPIFNKGDLISGTAPAGYTWYEIVLTPLSEKIIEVGQPPYWVGPWKNVHHKYLPFSIKKNGQFYSGWFELSMDTATEKIILYRAAICKTPQTNVKAGY